MPCIAFLLPDFAMGGAERVVLTLIEAFVNQGIEVDLVLVRAEGELLPQLPSSVNIVSLGAKRLRDALVPLVRYLRHRKPDVVHARMWPVTLVAIVARALASSAPRIVIGEDSVLSRAYAGRGVMHRLFLRGSIALLYPRADARVAVSEGVADDLVKLGALDRNSINVLHNPLALPQSDEDPVKIEWAGDGARILAVGNLIPVKNFGLLLESFARLVESRPASLVIVGEGPERLALENLARNLRIAERVLMPGIADDPRPYYASADVLVLSSRHEAFGNVLVEAMRHGLTVVSTDCPTGPREILDGGRYGYLTSCDDPEALSGALAQAIERPFAAEILRRRAEELSGPHILHSYLELMLPGYTDEA